MQFSELFGEIVNLTREHDRQSFCCGVKNLDNYIRDRAIGDTEKNVSRVFVLPLMEKPQTIVGYYSLSSLQIPLGQLPDTVAQRLPRYPNIGSTLLGKLAVDENWQRGKCNFRLGEHLLVDAMFKAWIASQSVASYALIVDVLVAEKGEPSRLYTDKGFQAFKDTLNRLYLPMRTIEDILKALQIIKFR